MSKLTKWKKEDWKIASENDGDERPSVVIAIGEKIYDGEKTYIQEEIYRDIMECIFLNNSFYKVYVNFNETPKIVTYFNGMLVANNKQFEERKRKILTVLKSMYAPDVLKAYLDFQKLNHHNDLKASPSIEILRYRIKEATGEDDVYQMMFLKPIVEEFITADLIAKTDDEVSQLDDIEFRETVIAMISNNKFHTKKYTDWIKAQGEEGTKTMIVNELIRRYMGGR